MFGDSPSFSEHARYTHIDALFGDPGRNTIDWTLIQTHWTDLMQGALSIGEGKLSSARSCCCAAWAATRARTACRVIRTIQLLRYISDPLLRERVTAATNKVEAYNGYTGWLLFGNADHAPTPAPTGQGRHTHERQHCSAPPRPPARCLPAGARTRRCGGRIRAPRDATSRCFPAVREDVV